MFKAFVNLNGKEEKVLVSFSFEGDKKAYISIYLNDGYYQFEQEVTGGNDEYGYEFTADDLDSFLSKELVSDNFIKF